jgi:hypothetical protein
MTTLIVTSAQAESARAAAAQFEGGQGMFIVPLYTGAEITHYISSGIVSDEILNALPEGVDVSDEPYAAIERLGLSLDAIEPTPE